MYYVGNKEKLLTLILILKCDWTCNILYSYGYSFEYTKFCFDYQYIGYNIKQVMTLKMILRDRIIVCLYINIQTDIEKRIFVFCKYNLLIDVCERLTTCGVKKFGSSISSPLFHYRFINILRQTIDIRCVSFNRGN